MSQLIIVVFPRFKLFITYFTSCSFKPFPNSQPTQHIIDNKQGGGALNFHIFSLALVFFVSG